MRLLGVVVAHTDIKQTLGEDMNKGQNAKRGRRGFSLMEVMAAIVIIAVVATASVTGLSSLRGKANDKLDQTNIAELNSKVQAYHLEHSRWPSANLSQLVRSGYIESKALVTPFGGRYTFDKNTLSVINKNAP